LCYAIVMAQAKPRPTIKSVTGNYKPKGQRRLVTALLLLIITLAGFLLVKHIQHDQAIAKEGAQYAAAEADLNRLADQIVLKFGKPMNRQTLNYCRSGNYCRTSVVLTYGVSNKSDGALLSQQINNIVSNKLSHMGEHNLHCNYEPIYDADKGSLIAHLNCAKTGALVDGFPLRITE